jgi:agmatine/peptidylarginine deiminase
MYRIRSDIEKTNYVFIVWSPDYYNHLYRQLILGLVASEIKIAIILNCEDHKNQLILELSYYNIDSSSIEFILANYNSHWIRDYFPLVGKDSSGKLQLIDYNYDKNKRPLDNSISNAVAVFLNIPLVKMDINMEGGNLITDGRGVFIATDHLFRLNGLDNNSKNVKELREYFNNYFDCKELVIVPSLNCEETGHIDVIWSYYQEKKLVHSLISIENNKDNEVINRQIRIIEETYRKLNIDIRIGQLHAASYQEEYDEYSWQYSYVNSIICNKSIILPMYGESTDSEAYKSWSKLMPDHHIYPVYAKELARNYGSLHCISAQF